MSTPPDADAVIGCLLGQAVGDMMGLPAENLSPRRVRQLFPRLDRPGFLFGYGMGSDDTEHACITARAVLRSGGDTERFRRSLAWGLRWWFLAGPPGVGLATLKACVKLWLGLRRSGVYSAGNGPAMRAAILGVCNGPCDPTVAVWYSTWVTHTDPQAWCGAWMVADAAYEAVGSRYAQRPVDAGFLVRWVHLLSEHVSGSDLARNTATAAEALSSGRSVSELVALLGLKRGVSGYIAHTVPVAVFAFFRHPDDYRAAIQAVIRCGGDTDTVAAITGALVGARVGKGGIPAEWLNRWVDWPLTVRHMEALGRKLAEGKWQTAPQAGVPWAWWAVPGRNFVFFVVVLGHMVRRLLPPY